MSVEDIKNRIKSDQLPWAFSCPPEWEDLVVELDQSLAEIDPDYEVRQVKSKFGGLRYYVEFSLNTTMEQRYKMRCLIADAESRSFDL